MSSHDLPTENRRLHILKCLKLSPSYRMSSVLLKEMLTRIGLGVSLAVIENDMAWLERLDLIATEELGDYLIALLRNEGVEVVDGVTLIKGIARPAPEH